MNAADTHREKVERADAALKESQEPVMDDPTVFVKGAALGALTMIALAELGQAHGTDPRVRSLAGRMKHRQQAFLDDLRSIAASKQLDVPTSLVHGDEQMLAGAPEAEEAFDRWWARHAEDEYLEALLLAQAASRMTDAELAALAARAVPVFEAEREALLEAAVR
jgi:putative membrane protein